MTKLRLIAVMRLSSKAQIKGHGKERQEQDEIKAYVDELDACLVDTWFIAERATKHETVPISWEPKGNHRHEKSSLFSSGFRLKSVPSRRELNQKL